MKFTIIAILFATRVFSQDACPISQVPYAGESVWNTRSLFVPIEDGDDLDTLQNEVQWTITDKVRMLCPGTCGGNVRTFDILSAAIASDGQSASYEIQERIYIRASYHDKSGKVIRVVRKGETPIKTLLVLCPEGKFEGIYFISDNGGFVKYQ